MLSREALRSLALGAALTPLCFSLGYFTRDLTVGREPPASIPKLPDGRVEGCLACHRSTEGLAAPHDPEVIGCSACHLGEPRSLDAARAHRGMEVIAGDLATVYETCGRAGCHEGEAARVTSSLMARAPGILSVNRFAFGEQVSPDGDPGGFSSLDGQRPPSSPAESHARKLCGSCHLGARKQGRGDQGFFSRGGGCTACHLAPPKLPSPRKNGPLHADVSASVSEDRCAGCHSRSGRIAMSYHGVVELEPHDPRVTSALPDGRPVGKAPEDVHAKAGMTCVDCHTERDLMGDGEEHRHALEGVEVRCGDCHSAPSQRAPSDDAARAAEVLRRGWKRRGMPPLPEGAALRTSAGTELWRTHAPTRSMALATTGERRDIPRARPAAHHAMRGHERLDCQACHTVWAPRCTKCHTRFDPNGKDVDHLTGAETAGRWIEEAGGNGFGAPLLAFGPRGTIGPFVEGMILRLELGDAGAPVDRAFYAPLDAHTTGKARSCASCHDERASMEAYPEAGEVTRAGARLLDAAERAAVARVGECIGCHGRYEDRVFADFAASARRIAQKTRDPAAAKCRVDFRGARESR